MLITSLEPLTVFMLDVAFPKISVDYTAWDFPAEHGQREVHARN